MIVLVSDSSVLIDLDLTDLLSEFFSLPYSAVVPSDLFDQELNCLETATQRQLQDMGLELVDLTAEQVLGTSELYSENVNTLSWYDCSAITLAHDNNWKLLVGDMAMRKKAQSINLEYCGFLWVMDELLSAEIITSAKYVTVLEKILHDPKFRLPISEIKKRINSLA